VREFIYEQAPFPECHASTIAETPAGLVAAWFGGTEEKHPDVGIWVSRRDGARWSPPVEVANGVQADGKRVPTWNPVLFQAPGGPLLLFYKAGPSPSQWWGMMTTSTNAGQSWATPRRLPENIFGPIKNKPVLLDNGTLLCPSSTEDDGWRIHLERTRDRGVTWTRTPPLNDGRKFGAIQPTVLFHPGQRLQLLCRSRQGRITECWSEDDGQSWSDMQATALPNPNSGIDAVTLRDRGPAGERTHLLVYNPVLKGRSPLIVASSNDGKTWAPVAVLEWEPGEYSYPAVIQTQDGGIHVTYTWRRERIRYVALALDQLKPGGNLVAGEVKTPGSALGNGAPTVLSAIRACGGFGESADRQRVRVLHLETGKETGVDCRVENGPRADPPLSPTDLIVVPAVRP
jgi:predicted neuraminidase